MPNIAINNYCCLKCPYCFADDMVQEKSMSITLDDFRKILMFSGKTREHVALIGGEPTMHPDFINILKETNKYCKETDTSSTLFTNGIYLEQYLPYISERMGILLNLNSPTTMKDEYWKATMELLDHVDSLSWLEDLETGPARINIGCNVYPGLTDYSYIWKIVDKYHITHLRTSVVSPGGIYYNMRSDKEAYYALMKPIFLEHCKNAIKHRCLLHMDCGRIPACYFSSEELELVHQACGNTYESEFCEPVIDIKANFKCYACFGQSDKEVDMRDFNDMIELRRYLLAKITLPHVEGNCTGKCSTCKKFDLLQCQGGCLSFARRDKC